MIFSLWVLGYLVNIPVLQFDLLAWKLRQRLPLQGFDVFADRGFLPCSTKVIRCALNPMKQTFSLIIILLFVLSHKILWVEQNQINNSRI